MPKTPLQIPIKLLKQGDGAFDSIADAMVPEPPQDCETQQLMDYGATVSVMRLGKMPLPIKLRLVEAYAQRWEIDTEDVESKEGFIDE